MLPLERKQRKLKRKENRNKVKSNEDEEGNKEQREAGCSGGCPEGAELKVDKEGDLTSTFSFEKFIVSLLLPTMLQI